jgi:hypothetical protein
MPITDEDIRKAMASMDPSLGVNADIFGSGAQGAQPMMVAPPPNSAASDLQAVQKQRDDYYQRRKAELAAQGLDETGRQAAMDKRDAKMQGRDERQLGGVDWNYFLDHSNNLGNAKFDADHAKQVADDTTGAFDKRRAQFDTDEQLVNQGVSAENQAITANQGQTEQRAKEQARADGNDANSQLSQTAQAQADAYFTQSGRPDLVGSMRGKSAAFIASNLQAVQQGIAQAAAKQIQDANIKNMEAQRGIQREQIGLERERMAQTASENAKNRDNALEVAGIKKYGKAGAAGGAPGAETVADTVGKASNIVNLINSGNVTGSTLGQVGNAVSSALGMETDRRTATESYEGALADTLVSMAATSPKLTKIIDSDGGMKVVTSALGGSGKTDKAKYEAYKRYYDTWKAEQADRGVQVPDLQPLKGPNDGGVLAQKPSGRRSTDAPPSVSGGWSNFKAH